MAAGVLGQTLTTPALAWKEGGPLDCVTSCYKERGWWGRVAPPGRRGVTAARGVSTEEPQQLGPSGWPFQSSRLEPGWDQPSRSLERLEALPCGQWGATAAPMAGAHDLDGQSRFTRPQVLRLRLTAAPAGSPQPQPDRALTLSQDAGKPRFWSSPGYLSQIYWWKEEPLPTPYYCFQGREDVLLRLELRTTDVE